MHKRLRGFTLMELMVTLAVAGIVVALAVPNFRQFLQNGRLTAASNDLIAAMHLARTEAVKRQTPVAVCASANPSDSPPTCSGGAFRAWVVWVDADNDWVIDNVAAEPVLGRHAALDATLTVRSDNDGRVKYLPIGFGAPPSGGITPTGNIVVCDERGLDSTTTGAIARAIVVAPTGRARVTRDPAEVDAALAAIGGSCP